MTMIVQLMVSGIALGFIYALVGIEYTLIWNSTGLLNFSHDKMITLGAYIFGATLMLDLGAPSWISVIVTLILMFIFGVLVAAGIFNPLRNMRATIFAVMGTIMLGKILYEAIRLIWGPVPFTVPGWLTGSVVIGNINVTVSNIVIIVVAIVVVAALQSFLTFTKTGKAMRCVAQNKKAAALMGINVSQNICVTTGVSAIICAIIGLLVIPLFNVDVNLANLIGLKGFFGGMIVGVAENLSTLVLPAVYKDVVSFGLMIIFLLIRPQGILGKRA